jgi:hypothetical protein
MAKMTCPKCSKQYYGMGCPYCDYPPVAPDKGEGQRRFLFGLVFIVTGLFLVSRYFSDSTPHWSAVLTAGLVFGLAGIHMVSVQRLYDENGRASALLGGLLLVSFSYLCFIGAFSDRAEWTSLPFLPDTWSHMLARTISGLFGVMLAAFSLKSFYLVIKRKGKR